MAVLKILEKKFKGSRGHLGKLSFGGGKFGRVFKILEKKFKGSRRHQGGKIGQCCLEVENWEVFKILEKN